MLPPGEATKSFAELAPPLRSACSRWDSSAAIVIVALGGGVIGDLAGFAAAILRRGIRFVQIPTTLLAQVDSSVGGKTGINTPQGKNLIGAFHQPSLVLADTDAAHDAARRARCAPATPRSPSTACSATRAFFAWLERHWQGVFGNDPAMLTRSHRRQRHAPRPRIVERDETETGDRMLLNLGHTFGHALEAWAGYSSRLLHGEAVAIGMCQAARFSEQLGLCPAGTAARIESHLRLVGLPTRVAHIPGAERPEPQALFALMAAGQESPRRPPHAHLAPRHRRRLRHPRCRRGRSRAVLGARGYTPSVIRPDSRAFSTSKALALHPIGDTPEPPLF